MMMMMAAALGDLSLPIINADLISWTQTHTDTLTPYNAIHTYTYMAADTDRNNITLFWMDV